MLCKCSVLWMATVCAFGCGDKSNKVPEDKNVVSAAAVDNTAGAQAVDSASANACLEPEDVDAKSVNETRTFLAGLDKLRAEAFQPEFELPERPVKPTDEPCVTRFAEAPARDEFKKAAKDFTRAIKKVERRLRKYIKAFNKGWSRLDFTGKSKPTKLGDAANAKGLTMSGATCLVSEIDGKCRRACMYRSWGQLKEHSAACRRDSGVGGRWETKCNAVFVCVADPPLTNTKAGIDYVSKTYRIKYGKRFGKDEEAAAQKFEKAIAAIGYGEVVKVPVVRGWKFNDNWIASSSPDDGAIIILSGDNPGCCESRVVAAAQQKAQ